MLRIAVGGVQHETNTFAGTRATFEEFVHADVWPSLTRGEALFEAVRGVNLPIAGFIDQARADGHELLPLLWCSAQPSGPVTPTNPRPVQVADFKRLYLNAINGRLE